MVTAACCCLCFALLRKLWVERLLWFFTCLSFPNHDVAFVVQNRKNWCIDKQGNNGRQTCIMLYSCVLWILHDREAAQPGGSYYISQRLTWLGWLHRWRQCGGRWAACSAWWRGVEKTRWRCRCWCATFECERIRWCSWGSTFSSASSRVGSGELRKQKNVCCARSLFVEI